MGCSSSVFPRLTETAVSDLAALGLSARALSQLQNCFNKIDVRHQGRIDLHEVYAYFSLDENPFLYHVFHQVQRHYLHEISLREFILCIYFFLIRNQDAIIGKDLMCSIH